mgnify:FL=1
MSKSVPTDTEMMAARVLASLSVQPVRVPLNDRHKLRDQDKYIAWLEARLQEVMKEAQDLDAQLYFARQ